MNKSKLILLAIASLLALAGCDSEEQQREAERRRANEQWVQDAQSHKPDQYGSGRVLFPSGEKSK
ncbi:putative lipoprotein [Cupriavidus taiwanensis]|uniref:hypothetical protein n=1 Tax=Cupriavidus taiwanensis TaxID=164546 RepID=UPI000E1AE84A|nr:hypothetical protein [Cupriavidus taiwanensis]SOZ14455.1 putative lipoprotein [Cupriavidus taiwanensis]SOZ25870.1 putative lipoprotein [Cupriavidus taiwanensis]SOZ45062.1 putative lipoprotein [Cupriavidus taiwanensis]